MAAQALDERPLAAAGLLPAKAASDRPAKRRHPHSASGGAARQYPPCQIRRHAPLLAGGCQPLRCSATRQMVRSASEETWQGRRPLAELSGQARHPGQPHLLWRAISPEEQLLPVALLRRCRRVLPAWPLGICAVSSAETAHAGNPRLENDNVRQHAVQQSSQLSAACARAADSRSVLWRRDAIFLNCARILLK